jgi:hypothetical protein
MKLSSNLLWCLRSVFERTAAYQFRLPKHCFTNKESHSSVKATWSMLDCLPLRLSKYRTRLSSKTLTSPRLSQLCRA